MSSNYRIGVGIYGYDYGATRLFNNAALSATNFERTLGRGQRQMGLWDQQMRAFGTTARYALAGAMVFGVTRGIAALNEFQVKLGEINSLAARVNPKTGNLAGLGGDLEKLGDFAVNTAAKFAQSVPDVEQFMSRFYSAFDPPAGARGMQQAQDFATSLSTLRLSLGSEGGDPFELASGIAGFMQGIPNVDVKKDSQRIADIIAESTRVSPVITGKDISRDIGRLSAGQTALNMSPEEIFTVYTLASKRGGSPALVGRGVSQLVQNTLLRPTTTKQKDAFAAMGLPTDPEGLRGMGGMAVLQKMLAFVGPLTVKNRRALANPDITDEEAIAAGGVSGNPGGLNTLSNAIGRSESFRVLLTLLSLPGGANDAMKKFIAGLKEAERVHRAEQRARIQLAAQPITRASKALSALNLQFMRNLQPLMNPVLSVLEKGSKTALAHPTAAKAAEYAFLASALGVGLGKIFPNKIGGPLSHIPGMGKMLGNPIAKVLAAQEAGNTFDPTRTPSGTATDPLWVVIAPLSKFVNEPEKTQKEKDKNPLDPLKKLPPTPVPIPRWLKPTGLALGAVIADETSAAITRKVTGGNNQPLWRQLFNPKSYTENIPRNFLALIGASGSDDKRRQQQALKNMTEAQRTRAFSHSPYGPGISTAPIQGVGTVTVKHQLSPEAKRILKAVDPSTVHVKFFGGKAPSHRGKPTTPRSGPR